MKAVLEQNGQSLVFESMYQEVAQILPSKRDKSVITWQLLTAAMAFVGNHLLDFDLIKNVVGSIFSLSSGCCNLH